MRKITKRQQEIADYFVKSIREDEYTPSMREAADFFGVTEGAIQCHFRAFEKKDILHRVPGKVRVMKIGEGYGK
jgi:SOS-response transcriptional repressor LexA